MDSTRFLHIFGSFDLGGAEARTVALIGAFGPGVRHSIWVADGNALSARDQLPPGVQVDFPEAEGRRVSGTPTPARLLALARAMQGHDLILTYAWGAMDAVLAHRLFRRPLGLPRLVHHEDGFDAVRATGWVDAARLAYRRMAMRGADAVVVPSRSLSTWAREHWGVTPAQLVHITNGVAFDPVPTLPMPGLSPREGRTLVCAVAGLRPVKNLRRLVRAGAAAGEDIDLVILGEGPERAAILHEAEALGCADRVALPGFVPTPRAHLGAAHIFALSSDSEQCPLSVIEAMAAGLPVVSTDVGDIAAMVASENRPFIVPVEDEAGFARAIRQLADDPALRARIGAANADKARADFGFAAMVGAYRALYGRLLV